MVYRLDVSPEIEQEITAVATQFKNSFHDEYVHSDAQDAVASVVAKIVSILEVGPALGHLSSNVTDMLSDEIAGTFKYCGAIPTCMDCARYSFSNLVLRAQHEADSRA